MIQNGLEYLNSRLIFGMMPGLASTRKLCEALGNPQKKFKTIHVVGTRVVEVACVGQCLFGTEILYVTAEEYTL